MVAYCVLDLVPLVCSWLASWTSLLRRFLRFKFLAPHIQVFSYSWIGFNINASVGEYDVLTNPISIPASDFSAPQIGFDNVCASWIFTDESITS